MQVSTTSDFSTTVYDQSNITFTSSQIAGLLYSTQYYWRVNASNTVGTSSWSSIWDFTTISEPLDVIRGYWAMEDVTGSTIINDGSVFENDGPVIGNVESVTGKFDQALRLDGSSYIRVPDNVSLDITDQITMAIWIKPEEYRKQQIMRKKNGPTGYEITLGFDGNNTVSARLNGTNNYRIYSTSEYPIDGTWMHIAATYNGSEFKLYINGVVESSTSTVPTVISVNNDPLEIGADDDGDDKFKGAIDDVQIYKVALSQTEIED